MSDNQTYNATKQKSNMKHYLLFLILLINSNVAYSFDTDNLEDSKTLLQQYEAAKSKADEGDLDSMLEVFSIFYQTYPALEDKVQEAATYLTKAAIEGNTSAQFNMGYLQQNGDVFEENIDKATVWLKKAESKGHVKSKRQLGFIYLVKFQSNNGDNSLYQQAKYWFLKGAEANDAPSMRQLGLGILAHEQSNHDIAKQWLVKAYSLGDAKAARYLGMYAHLKYLEDSIDTDLKSAIDWYEKSASLGDIKAESWLKNNSQ